jgi:hypothetical protein
MPLHRDSAALAASPVRDGVMSNMNNTEIWHKIGHLFEKDDGSLPDIFVENLTNEQIVTVYNWVVSEAGIYGEPTLWSIKEERDIPVKEIDNPAQKFIDKEVEIFRHGLNDLIINGIKIPHLTISVEVGGVSFDYRKGKDWSSKEVRALLDFLLHIDRIAPDSKIFQAEEGSYEKPSIEFEELFQSIRVKNS